MGWSRPEFKPNTLAGSAGTTEEASLQAVWAKKTCFWRTMLHLNQNKLNIILQGTYSDFCNMLVSSIEQGSLVISKSSHCHQGILSTPNTEHNEAAACLASDDHTLFF